MSNDTDNHNHEHNSLSGHEVYDAGNNEDFYLNMAESTILFGGYYTPNRQMAFMSLTHPVTKEVFTPIFNVSLTEALGFMKNIKIKKGAKRIRLEPAPAWELFSTAIRHNRLLRLNPGSEQAKDLSLDEIGKIAAMAIRFRDENKAPDDAEPKKKRMTVLGFEKFIKPKKT